MGVPESFTMGGSCRTCPRKTIHGSFVKEIYITARSASNLTVRVAYSADQPSRAKITVTADGIDFVMPTEMIVSKFKRDSARPRVVEDLTMELTRKHAREACIKVSNNEFVVEAASRYLGWADKNQHKEYVIDASNPFSTQFKYTRFNATHASPRNVSALTGLRRTVKAKEVSSNGKEGAAMQGDDTLMADMSASQ